MSIDNTVKTWGIDEKGMFYLDNFIFRGIKDYNKKTGLYSLPNFDKIRIDKIRDPLSQSEFDINRWNAIVVATFTWDKKNFDYINNNERLLQLRNQYENKESFPLVIGVSVNPAVNTRESFENNELSSFDAIVLETHPEGSYIILKWQKDKLIHSLKTGVCDLKDNDKLLFKGKKEI